VPTTVFLQQNDSSIEVADQKWQHNICKTGKKDRKEVNQIVQWNGTQTLSFWGSVQANEINGTNSEQFHMNVKHDEQLMIFVAPQVMRSIGLVYIEEVQIHGVIMYRFNIPNSVAANASEVPQNAAYYQFGRSGVMNRTAASNLSPVYLSKPHFLDADPYYLNAVEGLNPNAEIHESIVDIEPITGLPMNAYERLQINMRVQDVFVTYENMTEVYLPVVWVEQAVTITAELAQKIFVQCLLIGHHSLHGAVYWVVHRKCNDCSPCWIFHLLVDICLQNDQC